MKGLLLPCYVENISTRKDKSVKIIIGTQELSPDVAGRIFELMNHLAVCYLASKNIDQNEIDQVDKVNPDFASKSQSQRIRNVLFKLFEQNNEGYINFDSYYTAKTDLIIKHYKSQLKS